MSTTIGRSYCSKDDGNAAAVGKEDDTNRANNKDSDKAAAGAAGNDVV